MRLKVLALFFLLAGIARPLVAQEPLPAQDLNMKTGPEAGEKIPPFRAMDQNGHWQDFDSLKGPHGLVLVFHRSADW